MKIKNLITIHNKENFLKYDLNDILDKSIEEISKSFVDNKVDSILILKDSKPYYILTVTDVIDAFVNSLEKIKLFQYFNLYKKDLLTAKIEDSLLDSYKKMREKRYHHLIIVDKNGNFVTVLTLEDIANFLTEIAIKDPLTGLYNKGFFEFLIDKCKNEDIEVGIIFVDLDNFKELNDKYGHLFGDKVLEKVSNVIKKNIRDIDYAFRFGGDEFVVVVFSTFDDLEKIKNRIDKEINSLVIEGKKISASLGYAHYKTDSENLEEVIKIADERMYENKRRKK